MNTQETQSTQSQKTVVAFIVGLIVGGLITWMFFGTPESPSETQNDPDEAVTDVDTSKDTFDESEDTSNRNTADTATKTDTADTAEVTDSPTMETGEGSVSVSDQVAGNSVSIDAAVFPQSEGWIAVRDYNDDQLGSVLGAARFSQEQGLIPDEVTLLRATESGGEYAVVFYTENGDREFSLANDVQVDGIMETFTAE